ncbi:DNA polymerase III subunit gamma/tau, partial [human gut metagenome]
RYQEVAQTLNVLDYDTYFSMTETLLSGNYVEALLSFDNVLARGFSGQTFMAGLNRHLRDLLVARNEPSLRLLEFTGTLMERYRTQAAACPPEFLFRRHIAAHGPRRQNQAIVQPTAARRTGTDEDRRSRSKKNKPRRSRKSSVAGTGSDRPRAIRTGPSAIDTTDGSRARSSTGYG